MRHHILLLLFLPTCTIGVHAQTEKQDTTAIMRVGYISGNLNTLAGAVDKVTEARMNKGLVTSSLDALSGQAAGVQVTSGGNQEAMVSAHARRSEIPAGWSIMRSRGIGHYGTGGL